MPRMVPLHWRELERVFLAAGFRFVHQEGSHRTYSKPGILRPIVMPAYDEVPVFIICANLRTANLDRAEFFRLLGRG